MAALQAVLGDTFKFPYLEKTPEHGDNKKLCHPSCQGKSVNKIRRSSYIVAPLL